jgi:hypothetical protein
MPTDESGSNGGLALGPNGSRLHMPCSICNTAVPGYGMRAEFPTARSSAARDGGRVEGGYAYKSWLYKSWLYNGAL